LTRADGLRTLDTRTEQQRQAEDFARDSQRVNREIIVRSRFPAFLPQMM